MQMTTKKFEVEEALESLFVSELQAKLGSSPDGITQAEKQKRLTQYGLPNDYAIFR
jgi:H+-transporting ATPase